MNKVSGAISGSSPSGQANLRCPDAPRVDPGRKVKSQHRIGKELIRWQFVPRSSRKGYLTRDFYIGSRHYKWLSNAVTKDGLLRLGIYAGEQQ